MPAALPQFENWHLSTGSSGHLWLSLDKSGSTTNTLSNSVLNELDSILSFIEESNALPGVIFRSAKASGFILGADVNEFVGLESAARAAELAAVGQALFQRIEDLPCPTAAVMNGYTLGGGLELALACTYRVAVRSFERCIGLPEVQLGIHPGFGGSVRSVQLLGVPLALDLMLTGRSLSPVEAQRGGLVDRLAATGEGEAAALKLMSRRSKPQRAAWYLRPLNSSLLRPIVAKRLRKQVGRKAKPEHYPAPYALIDLWQQHGAAGAAAYRAEAESIGELLVSKTCGNLVRLFQLRERLRNLAPKSDAVQNVHVVGGGVMGGDIAAWCALRDLQVTVQDREEKYLEPAFARAKKLFRKRLKAPGAAASAMRRLQADIEGNGLKQADLVIEAIVEDLDAKQQLFQQVLSEAPAGAVLATNTSSIRLEDIGAGLNQPDRLVGIHFFNPVASMPLVEVIRTDSTDPEIFNKALAFVTRIGKLPLPCASAPGFLVNRILMPYMLEALKAHEDGHAIETIDKAARSFGMPMGPIELADRVGLDVALHVATILSASFGGEPPKLLSDKVESGHLGLKSPEGGFYRYENGKPRRQKTFPAPGDELVDRLILMLVNEAAACYRAGVVDDLDLLDAGVVFGTGFAPFRGGPIQYARQCGQEAILERLRRLETAFGDRFQPDPAWQDIFSQE